MERDICDMFGNEFKFYRHSCVPRRTIPAEAGISQQQRQRRVESAAGGKQRRWRFINEIPASAGMVCLGTGDLWANWAWRLFCRKGINNASSDY